MIDHIGIGTQNFDEMKKFYTEALASLGFKIIMEFPEAVGVGTPENPFFWILRKSEKSDTHIGFSSRDRASVDMFYDAALRAGGRDNGSPGLRTEYHPNYYAAFVLDPDGNNIEAVCHQPE